MDDDNSNDQREALISTVVRELQSRFAERASEVAAAQAELAVGNALEVWSLILSRLRGNAT